MSLLCCAMLCRWHAVQSTAASDRGSTGQSGTEHIKLVGAAADLCLLVTAIFCSGTGSSDITVILLSHGSRRACTPRTNQRGPRTLTKFVLLVFAAHQVEEGHWRDLLLQRFGPMLQSNHVNFQLDVLTDYGSDPLSGVAGAVVSTAEQLNAAALVVCGHSKGTFAEWLLGSVSDFAVHHSAVPVVVLHGSEFAPEVAP